jgi:hypothetical protein
MVAWLRGNGEAVGTDNVPAEAWMTLGAHGVLIFPIYSKLAQIGNQKRMPYLAPKISKFCMMLDWGIINNFLNCAHIQISIDVELKFLEQIHNLYFWWIFKGV